MNQNPIHKCEWPRDSAWTVQWKPKQRLERTKTHTYSQRNWSINYYQADLTIGLGANITFTRNFHHSQKHTLSSNVLNALISDTHSPGPGLGVLSRLTYCSLHCFPIGRSEHRSEERLQRWIKHRYTKLNYKSYPRHFLWECVNTHEDIVQLNTHALTHIHHTHKFLWECVYTHEERVQLNTHTYTIKNKGVQLVHVQRDY